MSQPPTVRLSGQGQAAEDYALTVDGHDITRAVTGIELHLGADQHPVLVLHPAVFEADTDGAAELVFPEETRELLVRYGWTPPPQA